jgi:hypothetical protein
MPSGVPRRAGAAWRAAKRIVLEQGLHALQYRGSREDAGAEGAAPTRSTSRMGAPRAHASRPEAEAKAGLLAAGRI